MSFFCSVLRRGCEMLLFCLTSSQSLSDLVCHWCSVRRLFMSSKRITWPRCEYQVSSYQYQSLVDTGQALTFLGLFSLSPKSPYRIYEELCLQHDFIWNELLGPVRNDKLFILLSHCQHVQVPVCAHPHHHLWLSFYHSH